MAQLPRRAARPAGAAPTEKSLRDAALAHVARFATTQAGLVRVLERRVERWARAVEAPDPQVVADARRAAAIVAAKLVALGLVDDAAFAAARARRLTRAGRSRLQVTAHLAARGVTGEAARQAAPTNPEAELAAAVLLARRRRIGPFRVGEADAAEQRRELGVLARAGFPQDVATHALNLDTATAEELVLTLREL
jgi:regulatory protein